MGNVICKGLCPVPKQGLSERFVETFIWLNRMLQEEMGFVNPNEDHSWLVPIFVQSVLLFGNNVV